MDCKFIPYILLNKKHNAKNNIYVHTNGSEALLSEARSAEDVEQFSHTSLGGSLVYLKSDQAI